MAPSIHSEDSDVQYKLSVLDGALMIEQRCKEIQIKLCKKIIDNNWGWESKFQCKVMTTELERKKRRGVKLCTEVICWSPIQNAKSRS